MAIRLETVEAITADRDLVKRHIAFLTAELESLKAKTELLADEQTRSEEIALRINDCKAYLETLEAQLPLAVAELSKRIRQLNNAKFSMILFEKYVCLHSLRDIAEKLGLTLNTIYHAHCNARDAYNLANGIQPYKDSRGRKKGNPNA